MEIPLDMSVGGSKPPPPPYREPLVGSTFCTMSRPSVITQAPKREPTCNQENKEAPKKPTVMCDDLSPATGMSPAKICGSFCELFFFDFSSKIPMKLTYL